MADEEKKEAAPAEGEEGTPSFFQKFKMFIFIGAGLVLIGGGVGLFFVLSKKDPPPVAEGAKPAEGQGEAKAAPGEAKEAKPQEAPPVDAAPAKPDVEEIELGDLEKEMVQGEDVASADINEALQVKLDPLVVNIFEKNAIHYLKLQMEFSVSTPEAVEEARLNKPKFRDRALFIVSDTTLREVLSPGGKALLKEDIISAFNKILKKGKVTQLYFTDFTIQ